MSYNNQYQSNPYQQAPAAEQGGYDYNNQGANYNQGAYNNYDQVSTPLSAPRPMRIANCASCDSGRRLGEGIRTMN